MGLYLDYNASAPMLEGSMDAIIKAMQLIGNPSSIHTSGRKVKTVIEDARELVAGTIGTYPQNIIFTSGIGVLLESVIIPETTDCEKMKLKNIANIVVYLIFPLFVIEIMSQYYYRKKLNASSIEI